MASSARFWRQSARAQTRFVMIALLRSFLYNNCYLLLALRNMPDPKTSRAASPDGAAFATNLHGIVWEARADTGELTRFGGEARSILGAYSDLAKPRFSLDMFHPDDR